MKGKRRASCAFPAGCLAGWCILGTTTRAPTMATRSFADHPRSQGRLFLTVVKRLCVPKAWKAAKERRVR
jgi:hypothetical protein